MNRIALLPPHCSHRMQPLDVSVFGPFKTAANQLCADWVKMHPGRTMQHTDLSPVYKEALRLGASESNIISGFAAIIGKYLQISILRQAKLQTVHTRMMRS